MELVDVRFNRILEMWDSLYRSVVRSLDMHRTSAQSFASSTLAGVSPAKDLLGDAGIPSAITYGDQQGLACSALFNAEDSSYLCADIQVRLSKLLRDLSDVILQAQNSNYSPSMLQELMWMQAEREQEFQTVQAVVNSLGYTKAAALDTQLECLRMRPFHSASKFP
jgi:hypothetical protein